MQKDCRYLDNFFDAIRLCSIAILHGAVNLIAAILALVQSIIHTNARPSFIFFLDFILGGPNHTLRQILKREGIVFVLGWERAERRVNLHLLENLSSCALEKRLLLSAV